MGLENVINNIVDSKILDLHCAYIAKVISVSGTKATVQPLDKIKQYGKEAKDRGIVVNVPIIQSARYKIKKETITYLTKLSNHVATSDTKDFAILSPLEAGDLVVCVCADRDISSSVNGISAVPAAGSHALSDSIIVGIL